MTINSCGYTEEEVLDRSRDASSSSVESSESNAPHNFDNEDGQLEPDERPSREEHPAPGDSSLPPMSLVDLLLPSIADLPYPYTDDRVRVPAGHDDLLATVRAALAIMDEDDFGDDDEEEGNTHAVAYHRNEVQGQ
ncbi:expressed unknown protein [Seminavis robusta]|uniref:Uncharacterized protein n=1 Tax=Seminavis robusta TaxID=568900 RepID=A0A9N8HBI5_9STRA|nr:expressed unknown protein [Seminavis robusta]|eukprot:Sro364_g127020.1 n/a (136) ;mRNA; f:14518-14925